MACHVTWIPAVNLAQLHIGKNKTKGEHRTLNDIGPISSSISCKKHLIWVSVLLNRMCWGLISAPRGKQPHSKAPEGNLAHPAHREGAHSPPRHKDCHWMGKFPLAKGKTREKHARHQQSTPPSQAESASQPTLLFCHGHIQDLLQGSKTAPPFWGHQPSTSTELLLQALQRQ